MKLKQRIIAFSAVILLVVLAVAALSGCGKGKTVDVTFDAANGTDPTVITVGKGGIPTAPADPTREGYTFMGWYLGDAKFDFTAVDESVTLVARWARHTYNVTFDTAGGTAVSSETVAHGETATAPEGVTREGYDFLGWYLGEEVYDFTTPVTGDLTLVARWTLYTYNVTFDAAGGTTVSPETVAHGATATAPEGVTREGYDFLGWYLGEEAYDFTTPVTGDLTLTARWQIKTYRVTFDPAGGTAAAPETVAHGETATAPEGVTREGHDFLGWYLGDEAYDFTTPVTGDLTLTAKWQIRTFTVKFVDADGTTLKTETVEWGKSATAPEAPAAEEDYVFAGWDCAFDRVTEDLTVRATYGKKTSVTFVNEENETLYIAYVAKGTTVTPPTLTPPEEKYEVEGYYLNGVSYDFSTAVESDLTIVVKWKIKTFTVTIDAANGDATTRVTLQWGEKAETPATPAREGYTFLGWYLGEEAYDFTTPVTSDLTLTAKWQIKTYRVTFDTAGGDARDPQTVEHGATATAPEGVTREGYDFLGWYLGEEVYDFTTPVTGDLTLTAKWQIKTYRVTFDTAGGDARDPQTVEHGATATAPENPTREYYRFGGWLLNGEAYDFTTPVTGDITLKANWIIINYKVIFDSNGGTMVPDVLANAGKPVEKPTDPTKEGFRFGGWLTAEGKLWDFDTIITGEMTLTAQWFDKTSAPEETVTGIYLDPGTVEMWVGVPALKLAMMPFAVSGPDGDFSLLEAAGITLRFVTTDPDVATVTADGSITPVSVGTALVYAIFETGGTINNGTDDVTVVAGDISNAVTVNVIETPEYFKAYQEDPENQQITLTSGTGVKAADFLNYPTGDYGVANIAAWYNDTKSVFTLTADDNQLVDFDQWYAWFEAYGIPTTLCAPTNFYQECADMWTEMVEKGMAVQSHSRFHRADYQYQNGKLSSAQNWMDFYLGQKNINSVESLRSLIIAYPCGYNQADLSSLLYIAGRGTVGRSNGFGATNYNLIGSYSGISEKSWQTLLNMAENGTGSWFSTHYHLISTSKNDIQNKLETLSEYVKSGRLWAATFAAASQYGQERDTATLTMGSTGRDIITFRLTDKMNDLLFDHALTVKIKVDSTWKGVRAYQNGQEMAARVVTDGGETYLIVDAIPDRGEVTVVRTELSGLTEGAERIAFTPVNAGDGNGMTTMTRRFAVDATVWKHVYATQNGKCLALDAAQIVSFAGQAYVEVTYEVGGGEVVLVPTTTAYDGRTSYTMSELYYGAVDPDPAIPVTVSSAAELRLFAAMVNQRRFTFEGYTILLTENIDLGNEAFTPIGWQSTSQSSSKNSYYHPFSGIFDGQGHTVSRLYENRVAFNAGLFGYTKGATVKNLHVTEANISGIGRVGGIIGIMDGGMLENCSFEGSLTNRGMNAVANTGSNTGGLVATAVSAVIRHASVNAEIFAYAAKNRSLYSFKSTYSNAYNAYNNGNSTGGAVGSITGEKGRPFTLIQNVMFNGKVTGVDLDGEGGNKVGGILGSGTSFTMIDCSATGTFTGYEKVGGVIGSLEGGSSGEVSVRHSIANGSVQGHDQVGGVAGFMGSTARAVIRDCVANATVTGAEGATYIGAAVGQVKASSNSPSVKNVFYLPALNAGMEPYVGLDGDRKVGGLTFVEMTLITDAIAPLNELALSAGYQTWEVSGDTISPVHYPIFRVVFYDKDGAVISTQNVANGMGVTDMPTAPEILGFRFLGWSVTDLSNVTEDTKVDALYEAVATYTVIFYDKDGNEIKRVTVNEGTDVEAPALSDLPGFRFLGWSANTDAVSADMEVHAQYEEVPIYTVKFVGKDGTTQLGDEQTINAGDDAVAPEAPQIDGYVFIGWSVDFTNVQSNLTVVACYAEIVTVRFLDAEGNVLDTVTTYVGAILTKPSVLPTAPSGQVFAYWSTDGETAFDFATPIPGAMDLTPVFEASATYTVTFQKADGTLIGTQTVTRRGNATLPALPNGVYWTVTAEEYAKMFDITADCTITLGTTSNAKTNYANPGNISLANEAGYRTAEGYGYDFTNWTTNLDGVYGAYEQESGASLTLNCDIVKFYMATQIANGMTATVEFRVNGRLVKTVEIDSTTTGVVLDGTITRGNPEIPAGQNEITVTIIGEGVVVKSLAIVKKV